MRWRAGEARRERISQLQERERSTRGGSCLLRSGLLFLLCLHSLQQHILFPEQLLSELSRFVVPSHVHRMLVAITRGYCRDDLGERGAWAAGNGVAAESQHERGRGGDGGREEIAAKATRERRHKAISERLQSVEEADGKTRQAAQASPPHLSTGFAPCARAAAAPYRIRSGQV